MSSTASEVANLLNVGGFDSSAFAEVISDYFHQETASSDSDDDDEFQETVGLFTTYSTTLHKPHKCYYTLLYTIIQ